MLNKIINQDLPIEISMALIFVPIFLTLLFLISRQTYNPKYKLETYFLAPPSNPNKRQFEIYSLIYTVVWIGIFGCVVVKQLYEQFDEWSYMKLCVSLALPNLLQPIIYPLDAEKNLPLLQRYSAKANIWLFIFGFTGNYWYTHYFYNVLKASYTFSAHRLNDVPISMFFATHFYFVTYHIFSTMILRAIETRYKPTFVRNVLFWAVVLSFSYFTGFMETLTISSFPYYSFEDRYMAYTLGSAFYSIYFIVSYPMFYRLDEKKEKHTMSQTIYEALATSMLVLFFLDFARIALGIDLNISGVAYYLYKSPYPGH